MAEGLRFKVWRLGFRFEGLQHKVYIGFLVYYLGREGARERERERERG